MNDDAADRLMAEVIREARRCGGGVHCRGMPGGSNECLASQLAIADPEPRGWREPDNRRTPCTPSRSKERFWTTVLDQPVTRRKPAAMRNDALEREPSQVFMSFGTMPSSCMGCLRPWLRTGDGRKKDE